MNVILLNPPWPGPGIGTRSQNRIIKKRSDLYLQFPILMAYSCACLKQGGHDVVFIDAVRDGLDYEQTTEKVIQADPDIIVMETVTPSINYDYAYMTELKEKTGARIIATGTHVSYFGTQSLEECEAIDVIVKNDYDTRIRDTADAIGDPEKLSSITGISFRDKEGLHDTGACFYDPDLDRLPFPDRETVPFERYGEAFYNRTPFTNMLTSRGCPNNCNYCITSNIMEGAQWRTRSVANVIEEIKELTGKYGVKEINFDDGTFNITRDRVMELCGELKRTGLNILWICNARVTPIDMEMLREMRSAGCKMIRYGVESADKNVLDYMGKNITLDQVRNAFRLTKKAGILALGGFMFGFPVDTRETIKKTVAFMKELKPDMIQASIPMPYPGTRMYEQVKEQGRLEFKEWEEFDMTHGPAVSPEGVTREEMKNILSRVYRTFYLRPGFILQTLLHIRRWSDIARIWRGFRSMLGLVRFHT